MAIEDGCPMVFDYPDIGGYRNESRGWRKRRRPDFHPVYASPVNRSKKHDEGQGRYGED